VFGLSPAILYLIVGLVFTNVVTLAGWSMSRARLDKARAETVACAARHEAFVAQVKAEGDKAARRTAEIIAKNTIIIEDIKNGYSAAIARVRSEYSERLRIKAAGGSGGGAMPGVSGPVTGADAADANAIPTPERLAKDCAETTVTANFLQAFIENQSEASRP